MYKNPAGGAITADDSITVVRNAARRVAGPTPIPIVLPPGTQLTARAISTTALMATDVGDDALVTPLDVGLTFAG